MSPAADKPSTAPVEQRSADSSDTVFLARQPILDRAGHVRAYELLCRSSGAGTAYQAQDPDMATARVLHGAIMNLGLPTLTPGCPAFLNVTRTLLMDDFVELLPKGAVVLEVLETVDVDDEVVEACSRLHKMGYAIALDDFIPGSSAERLFPFAQYLKVDVMLLDAEARRRVVKAIPKHLRLLAEKVETVEVFDDTVAEGFELFQGYYFCRPRTFQTKDMSIQQTMSLRLLEALNRPDVTIATLDDLIKRDAALCQRVLRYVNSAALGISQEIRSIRQALMLIGLDQIRKWVSIWALTGLNRTKVPEVMTMAIIRARCCERLGASIVGAEASGELFLLGLCSMLDALLERPMSEVLKVLSLPEKISSALLGNANVLERDLLDAVIAYERGDWTQATSSCTSLKVRASDLSPVYGEALQWANAFNA